MDDIQTEAQAKRLGKTEQGFGDPRDDIERSTVHVLRVPPDEREQEEMVPTVFSRFDYKYHLTDQVSSRTPKHNKHKANKNVYTQQWGLAHKNAVLSGNSGKQIYSPMPSLNVKAYAKRCMP